MNSSELRELSDEDFAQLEHDVETEAQRRHVLRQAKEQVEEIERSALAAQGVKDGEAWRETVLGYPEGYTVTHPIPGTDEQGTWTSLLNRNTWAPGVEGWRLEAPEDGRPPLWIRPASTVSAYTKGQEVVFPDYATGKVYRSTWPNPNTWSPEEFPDAWEEVEPEPTPPSPRTPLTPEEPPEDDVPVWVRPVWGAEEGGAYAHGARVRYPGEDDPVYVSIHQGWNTWAPDEYGWELEEP